MNIWAVLMVVAAGLFAGGAATFAWSRVPIWRRMASHEYVRDFAQTIDRTDKVQPALAVIAIAAAVLYALGSSGMQRILALVGAAGLLVVVVASFIVLVPLQRRIIALGSDASDELAAMRADWDRGNLGRSALAVLSFGALALAASL